jgi:hypothetical protein
VSVEDSHQSRFERTYSDILRNDGQNPRRRRYSLKTLLWTRENDLKSPEAWGVMRRVFPLPGPSLLLSKYVETGPVISEAVEDEDRAGRGSRCGKRHFL